MRRYRSVPRPIPQTLPTTRPPSNPSTIFDAALKAYERRTGRNLIAYPLTTQQQACDSPEAMLTILQSQATHFGLSWVGNEKLRTWLGPVVNVMYAFSATLGGGISPRVSPTKAFFAGVDVLFTAAKDEPQSQETLLDMFERIENCFRRLEVSTVVPPAPAMTDNMVEITIEVLDILAIATTEIKPNPTRNRVAGQTGLEVGLQKLDRLTSEGAQLASAEVRRIVKEKVRSATGQAKKVDRKAQDVESIVSDNIIDVVDNRLQGFVDGGRNRRASSKIHPTIRQMADDIVYLNRTQLLASIRKWQSPPDPSTNYHFACDRYHEGTAQWFLLGSIFQEWAATRSVLWIHGKPGSGKSVLCSTIISHISAMCEAGSASMAYFYFDKRDINKQSCHKMLSSLLTQLSYLSEPSFAILARLYRAHHDGAHQPSYKALTQCLKDMLSLPTHPPIYLIMDALDECPNEDGFPSVREQVLELIRDLDGHRFPNLHLCVTSRPEVDIRASLQPLASHFVSLHEERGHKDDIAQYVRSVVYSKTIQALRTDRDKELVIDRLSGRADGIFGWVFCKFEMLRGCLPQDFPHVIDELPPTLAETYERMLMEIAKGKRSQARLLLHCLAVAIRPLRVEELAELFAFDSDGARGGIPKLNKDWRWDDPEKGVLTVCSGLVHIHDYISDTRIVQFTHFSVMQFLTSGRLAILNGEVAQFHISLEQAHTVFAQACLGILLSSGNSIDDNWVESRSPLAEYAAQHWIDHAQFENVASHIQDGMRRLFDPTQPHFTAWCQLHDIDDGWCLFGDNSTPEDDGTPLYYASLCGFRDLVDHLIKKYPQSVITRGGRNHSPLVAALHKQHFDIAEQLLQHHADVDVRGYESRTPLHAASVGGLSDVTKWLLDNAADPNAVQDDLLTPLHLAAANGHLEVVLMLLKHGAKINAMNNNHSSPLHQASKNGHLEIVQILIDQGAEIDAGNGHQSTPLHLASFRGHTEVVRLLIKHGADVAARDKNQSTPLHLASSEMHEAVPLLVECGEKDNTRRDGASTPLHLSSSGRYEIALILIAHGAELNVRDARLSTPLHLASSAGLSDIVQLLIGYHADVDAENDTGETPFQVALSARHLDQKIITLLSGYRA